MASLQKVFNKGSVLTTILLLILIAVGTIVLELIALPTWPMFAVMVLFFLAEQKKSEVVKIIVGALTGEFLLWVMEALWIPATMKALGASYSSLIFILIFVGCIVLFGPLLPWFLNSFTFMIFLVAAMGKPFLPFQWMAITAIAGTAIIFGCILVNTIVASVSKPKIE
ncbi:hypothetical protein [Caproiciproducens sp.]